MMRKERCRDSSDQNKSKLQYFGFHGTSLMMHPKTSRASKRKKGLGKIPPEGETFPLRTYLGSNLEDNSESETDAVL